MVFTAPSARGCVSSRLALPGFHPNGNREAKRRALSRLGLHPNTAAVSLYDPLADRKPNAGALVGMSVKPFKDSKHLLAVFRLDSNTIVLDAKKPVLGTEFRLNMDSWWLFGAVFDCVSDQVLQELHQPDFVCV